MPGSSIDWHKVALLLRAQRDDDVVTCPYCKARGVVPYIAEHVLTTHAASPVAGKIRRAVAPDAADVVPAEKTPRPSPKRQPRR